MPIPWWRDAVVYQIYVRSFADSDGDGLGDIPGITARLDHVSRLGADAVWLTPFYTSPQHDHGYDVADYRDVDPRFGTLADADALVARAHELGLRMIVDLVPNHTSWDHPWFKAALASKPGSPERARYLFRDGRGRNGAQPPNNWRSVFGGPAWERVEDGQWYLHLFDRSQPDLDWTNPEVGDEFESILRFWLDRGVDGFRIDVAHGLFKAAGLPDVPNPQSGASGIDIDQRADHEPMWDQPEVHEVYRRWHKVLESYPGDRMAVAEAWVKTPESTARYIRSDELQQAFNFHWLTSSWSARDFRHVVTETLRAVGLVHGSPTWVLSNHDVVRHVTRYGGGAVGLARAKAATLTMLALPGSAYLYQGEELGLEEVDVPRKYWQDPGALRGGRAGRDGCRVPIPWEGTRPPYAFGPGTTQPWLPQPKGWASLTVAAEEADPASTLSFYREALGLRREVAVPAGEQVELLTTGRTVLAIRRGNGLVCVTNFGRGRAELPPEAGDLLLESTPGSVHDGRIGPDTAAWFRPTA